MTKDQARGLLATAALLLWLASLPACASPSARLQSQATEALDLARLLHFDACLATDPPLIHAQTCESMYRRLRTLEPAIEEEVAKAALGARLWRALRPRLEAAGERLLAGVERWVEGWIARKTGTAPP